MRSVEAYLEKRADPPDHLVLNLDSDADSGAPSAVTEVFGSLVRSKGGVAPAAGLGPVQLGRTGFSAVLWECDDPTEVPGVPSKQTLERLVTSAIRAAFPSRGSAVDRWLRDQPLGPSTGPKAHGYSYLAKWYSEHGSADFFEGVWRDAAVASELESRLRTGDAWGIVEALARR